MNFKINHIQIDNFRAFEHLETDLWDKTLISGDNETGKSTFASAITWCLFGKDIENNTTFEIVPTGKYGESSPSVVLDCNINKRIVTLSRLYKACKSRDGTFTEYKTVTSVNGLEVGVRKFQEWISQNICNEEVFKILSNPKTFVEDCPKEPKELLWQSQRRLLMGLIKDNVTDKEIVNENKEWEDLYEPLNRYNTVTEYFKYLKTKYSESQKKLDSFLAKISQQEKNIVEVKFSEEEILSEMETIEEQAEEIKSKMKSEWTDKIQNILSVINELSSKKTNLFNEYIEKYREFEEIKKDYQRELERVQNECENLMGKAKSYSEAIEKLKKTTVVEICESCGQKLNPYSIEKSKKSLAERIKKGQYELERIMKRAAEYQKNLDNIKLAKRNIIAPTYPAKIEEIDLSIEKLKKEIMDIQAVNSKEDFENQLAELQERMDVLKEEYFKIETNKKANEELENLKLQHKNLVKEICEIQKMLDKSRGFIGHRCKAYEESINSLFENVRLILFEKNKSNDEIKETCLLTFKGHKYQDLSASTKIIASLELVAAFQKYYNVTVPCLVDNKESITDNLEINGQIIMLEVMREKCPVCGNLSVSRKGVDGKWECLSCGNKWEKKFKIYEV